MGDWFFMGNSQDIEARLCDYVEGMLDEESRAQIRQHFDANPAHAQLVEDLIRQRELLRGLPHAKAPGDVGETLQSQVERTMLLGAGRGGDAFAVRERRFPQMMAIAAVVLLAVALGLVVYGVIHLSNSHSNMIAVANPKSNTQGTAPELEQSQAAAAPVDKDLSANRDAPERFLLSAPVTRAMGLEQGAVEQSDAALIRDRLALLKTADGLAQTEDAAAKPAYSLSNTSVVKSALYLVVHTSKPEVVNQVIADRGFAFSAGGAGFGNNVQQVNGGVVLRVPEEKVLQPAGQVDQQSVQAMRARAAGQAAAPQATAPQGTAPSYEFDVASAQALSDLQQQVAAGDPAAQLRWYERAGNQPVQVSLADVQAGQAMTTHGMQPLASAAEAPSASAADEPVANGNAANAPGSAGGDAVGSNGGGGGGFGGAFGGGGGGGGAGGGGRGGGGGGGGGRGIGGRRRMPSTDDLAGKSNVYTNSAGNTGAPAEPNSPAPAGPAAAPPAAAIPTTIPTVSAESAGAPARQLAAGDLINIYAENPPAGAKVAPVQTVLIGTGGNAMLADVGPVTLAGLSNADAAAAISKGFELGTKQTIQFRVERVEPVFQADQNVAQLQLDHGNYKAAEPGATISPLEFNNLHPGAGLVHVVLIIAPPVTLPPATLPGSN